MYVHFKDEPEIGWIPFIPLHGISVPLGTFMPRSVVQNGDTLDRKSNWMNPYVSVALYITYPLGITVSDMNYNSTIDFYTLAPEAMSFIKVTIGGDGNFQKKKNK